MTSYLINGESVSGTNSADDFEIISGKDLNVDALLGIDTLVMSLNGDVDLSYSIYSDTIQVSSDESLITGQFKGFEDVTIYFDQDDSNILMSGGKWKKITIEGGDGIDKFTTPNTGVVHGRVYLTVDEYYPSYIKIWSDNNNLPDVKIKDIEVLSTVLVSAESNLYIYSINVLDQIQEFVGPSEGFQNTIYFSAYTTIDESRYSLKEVYIWNEGDYWYVGFEGQYVPVKLSNFQYADFLAAEIIYVQNKDLYSTTFGGRTLYGVESVQFYAENAEIKVANGLSLATFSELARINVEPTGTVTITGTATEGQTLSVSNNLVDTDGLGTITYTWKAGTTILGTGNTYILTQAQVGKTITVTATYTDGFGTAESVTSSPTDAVLPPPLTAGSHQLSVIVKEGVLAPAAVLLTGLAEFVGYSNGQISSHTVSYNGVSFNYDDVDALITTVVRDGNFTEEFQRELAYVAPFAADATYNDVVGLVGFAQISDVLLYIHSSYNPPSFFL